MDDEALRHQERRIREYVLMESPRGETIKHAEKVGSHASFGRRQDIWDVHTSKDRWWVITEPTNLYRQRDFKFMDMAFTFHLASRSDWRCGTSRASTTPSANDSPRPGGAGNRRPRPWTRRRRPR